MYQVIHYLLYNEFRLTFRVTCKYKIIRCPRMIITAKSREYSQTLTYKVLINHELFLILSSLLQPPPSLVRNSFIWNSTCLDSLMIEINCSSEKLVKCLTIRSFSHFCGLWLIFRTYYSLSRGRIDLKMPGKVENMINPLCGINKPCESTVKRQRQSRQRQPPPFGNKIRRRSRDSGNRRNRQYTSGKCTFIGHTSCSVLSNVLRSRWLEHVLSRVWNFPTICSSLFRPFSSFPSPPTYARCSKRHRRLCKLKQRFSNFLAERVTSANKIARRSWWNFFVSCRKRVETQMFLIQHALSDTILDVHYNIGCIIRSIPDCFGYEYLRLATCSEYLPHVNDTL